MSNFIYYEKLEDYETQVKKAKERDLYKSVLDEIREYINEFDFERLHEVCEHNLVEVLEMILQILDKVKE